MKFMLALFSFAIAMAYISFSNAQSTSLAGRYIKKSGGAGEMRVEKSDQGWRVFVDAAGIPRGGATAADCILVAVGDIKGNIFEGQIKNQLAELNEKASSNNAVAPGHKMTITFTPQFATATAADVSDLCALNHGLFGRYTKNRK
jgi:hypothetical protein